MKKTLVMLALLVLPLLGAASARDWDDGFIARDPVVNQPGHREWAWDGNDGLAIEAPVTVNYSPKGPARIVIEGPEDMLAHVRVGQGRIRVDDDYHFSGNGHLVATVSGVTVHKIVLAGSGRANLDGLNLNALNLAVMGSGAVNASGRAERLDLNIAGSGSVDMAGMSVRAADIRIAGSGNVDVSPRDQLNLVVSGSGNVRMASHPAKLNQIVTGSGGVRFVN